MIRETRQLSTTSVWGMNDCAIDQKRKAVREGQEHATSRRLSSEVHFGILQTPTGMVKSGLFSRPTGSAPETPGFARIASGQSLVAASTSGHVANSIRPQATVRQPAREPTGERKVTVCGEALDGLPVADILQVWLDVSDFPTFQRGERRKPMRSAKKL